MLLLGIFWGRQANWIWPLEFGQNSHVYYVPPLTAGESSLASKSGYPASVGVQSAWTWGLVIPHLSAAARIALCIWAPCELHSLQQPYFSSVHRGKFKQWNCTQLLVEVNVVGRKTVWTGPSKFVLCNWSYFCSQFLVPHPSDIWMRTSQQSAVIKN